MTKVITVICLLESCTIHCSEVTHMSLDHKQETGWKWWMHESKTIFFQKIHALWMSCLVSVGNFYILLLKDFTLYMWVYEHEGLG